MKSLKTDMAGSNRRPVLDRYTFAVAVILFFYMSMCVKMQAWAQGPCLLFLGEDNAPLAYAHVTQKKLNDSSKVFSATTDAHGKIRCPYQGHVAVSASYMGYHDYQDTLRIHPNHPAPSIRMAAQVELLEDVVVTGQMTGVTTQQAVQKVKVITQAQIQQRGAVTLRDVLRNETNIRLEQDNILGSSMSMQGISGENIKILVDGVPIIGRQGGNLDLSQINLDHVERIEIIEGPLSVSYGSNALAGTINIITKTQQEKPLEAQVEGYYETVGQYNVSAKAGIQKKGHLGGINLVRNQFTGWSDGEMANSRVKQWKPKTQYIGRFHYAHRWAKTQLRWKGEAFHEEIVNKGYPRSPYFVTAFDDYYKTLRVDNALFLKKQFKSHQTLDITAAYNYYQRTKNNYFTDLTTLRRELTDGSEQDTSRFDLMMSRGTYSFVPDSSVFSAQVGYDINIESALGQRIESKQQRIGDYALFAQAEWLPWRQFTVRPGLRVAHNTGFHAPLIPSVHLRYGVKSSAFRLSWARGFRALSLKELHFLFVDINHNIIGNKDLKAETSDNVQASWQWERPLDAQRKVDVEVGGFYNHIQHLITLAQSAPGAEFTYINVGIYKTMGANMQVAYSRKALSMMLGASYIGTYNQISEQHSVSPISFSPELVSRLTYLWKPIKTTFAILYKYNGKLPSFYIDEAGKVQNGFIATYQNADITATKNLLRDKLTLTAGFKNLFDVRNVSSQRAGGAHSASTGSTPMSWGRTCFIRVAMSF